MDVDGALRSAVGLSPHLGEQVTLGDHLTHVLGEVHQEFEFLGAQIDGRSVEVGFARADLPPGGRLDREYRVYLGPKEPDRLDAVGAHLDEAIQKGWFPSLTRFFTWLLTAAHEFIPNYGIAIILIYLSGMFLSNFMGRRIYHQIERLIDDAIPG